MPGWRVIRLADKAPDDMSDDYELNGQLMAHRADVVGMWINEHNETK